MHLVAELVLASELSEPGAVVGLLNDHRLSPRARLRRLLFDYLAADPTWYGRAPALLHFAVELPDDLVRLAPAYSEFHRDLRST